MKIKSFLALKIKCTNLQKNNKSNQKHRIELKVLRGVFFFRRFYVANFLDLWLTLLTDANFLLDFIGGAGVLVCSSPIFRWAFICTARTMPSQKEIISQNNWCQMKSFGAWDQTTDMRRNWLMPVPFLCAKDKI